MPKQVIDRDQLIDEAYQIASNDGISALSVRKVATACGIAVGSVYVYFPTKADLTTVVLTRFFDETFSEEFCVVRAGEHFTSYARRFRATLSEARASMSVDWFAEMRRLPARSTLPSKKCEARCSPTWSVDFSAFSTRTRPWIARASSDL